MNFRGRERDEFGAPLSRTGGNKSKPQANQTIVLVTNHLCRAAAGGLCPSPLCELERWVRGAEGDTLCCELGGIPDLRIRVNRADGSCEATEVQFATISGSLVAQHVQTATLGTSPHASMPEQPASELKP